jgi:hypothetical protein
MRFLGDGGMGEFYIFHFQLLIFDGTATCVTSQGPGFMLAPRKTSFRRQARMKRTIMLCALALITVSAIAQEKPAAKAAKPATKKAQATQAAMPMPKPSPEMQKLSKMLLGKWTAVVKEEAMGAMPASESSGEATFRHGPGGLSLIQEFRITSGSMAHFSGHGVTYWDEKAKNYSGLWCDSGTPGGCGPAGTSKWDGDNIVGYMEMPDETGKMSKYRMTYSDIKPDSVLFTMEAPDGSNGYKKMMTIAYTRPAATPATEKKP